MQRALVRLEREQQALRASEESFRQAFEYAPSGMAIAEMGGDQHGRLLRTNDALCRLLGRPASVLRRYSFSDLVHPEDIGTLLRTSAEGGRAELRLGRRDGTYVWVHLRNSVVADTTDGPRFLLTHVEDIEDRKRRELQLAFSHTRLLFTASARPAFRVRVVPQPEHGSFPAAGESRAFGGIRGTGTVNFNVVALGALAYADRRADREALIHAIGRGIGRTAVHEFAHQLLGPAGMDGNADPLTYEHGDLRAEHFYARLHWGPAAARLQQRIGLR